ncbi:MAG TPA: hypothetical protein PLE73_09060 [Spirochaetota bacterium]|nr:hypothetical protein [Spirochaetota bacterium]HPI23335.1 hypothetical protein [Spirochaetota bacterium]HPU89729.1 hypothetical protein [Spirochaetota bacterium]
MKKKTELAIRKLVTRSIGDAHSPELSLRILSELGIPPTESHLKLLEGADEDGIMVRLGRAAEAWANRPIKDPILNFLNAQDNGANSPGELLPLLGIEIHGFTRHLFETYLNRNSTYELIDAILCEMRSAMRHLADIDRLVQSGVRANLSLHKKLLRLGLHHLDEYLMITRSFDLDEGDLSHAQLFVLGCCCMNEERFKDAMHYFSIAAGIEPDDWRLYYNRAVACDRLEMNQEALNDYTAAIELEENAFQPYVNRGLLRSRLGDLDGAMEDFTAAIDCNAECVEAYVNRGILEASGGNHEYAIQDFSDALSIDPDLATVYCSRAMSYFHLGLKDLAHYDLSVSASLGHSPADELLLKLFSIDNRDTDRSVH